MAKKESYERKKGEPTARDIIRATRRIRKRWTPAKHQARRGDTLDKNAHAVGWQPPVVHVADIVGHQALVDEHEA